jgi:hypothetical protein
MRSPNLPGSFFGWKAAIARCTSVNVSVADSFGEFSLNGPADELELEAAEKQFGKALPEDFKAFLLEHDGGEGFLGEHYFVLWRVCELVPFNRDYEVADYAPGLIVFGSDGGGEGYGFDTRAYPYPVVIVPFIGMSLEDSILVGDSFTDLLERMRTVTDSLF